MRNIMHRLCFLACFMLQILIQEGDAANMYTIYIPRFVRSGTSTEVIAEILESENPVALTATLKSSNFSSEVKTVIAPGMTETIMFDKIPYGYDGKTDFRLFVIGTDSETGDVLFKNETRDGSIRYQKKSLSIFIQTDKAIYQPSQTIKFRAVVTTPDLLPFDGNATYKLLDPSNNIILLKKDAQLVNGVTGSEYQLGRYSTTGDWKVTYEVRGYSESMSLTVQEYKLPKFKVDIKFDQTYLHSKSPRLSGTFSGWYTFGEKVSGMARLEISRSTYTRQFQLPVVILHKYQLVNGTTSFSVPLKKIKSQLKWDSNRDSDKLNIKASITEKNTGEKQESKKTLGLFRDRLKITQLSAPTTYKPGLPYKAYLRVTEQDDTPLSIEETGDLKINISVRYRGGKNWNYTLFHLPVDENGVAILNMIPVENAGDLHFARGFGEIKDYQWRTDWTARKFKSPSNSFLQITIPDSSLSVGDTLKLDIHTTYIAEEYNILVMSRGKIIKTDVVASSAYDDSKKFSYKFLLTKEMSPSINVIVSYTTHEGEIVADGRNVIVQATLENKVAISTSTNRTDAGTDVSITVTSAPGSFVGLRAIDKSILLLKSGNDITQEKIFTDLDEYGTGQNRRSSGFGYYGYGYGWMNYGQAGDVSQVFEDSGILVLTNALLHSERPSHYYYGGGFSAMQGRAIGQAESAYADTGRPLKRTASAKSSSTIEARTRFPETWIWTDSYASADGEVTFKYNTPDTITTWELSSFAVSDVKGLGVTEQNSKITVFRNFFISLDLPPTMIRDEILNMRTTIFNYFEKDLMATVTLKQNEWYDLVIVGDDPVAAGHVRKILIPGKDSVVVVFPIKFKKSGLSRIAVEARTDIANDAIEKVLVVKPEGIPQTISYNTLIDRKEYDKETVEIFDIDIPDGVVEGSSYVEFSVSGNLFGNALSNLGSLLRMPTGCGEQTMVRFAPDIYITLYLRDVGQLTNKIKEKAYTHIRHGYQNMLRYQHGDGSFSAFGNSDKSGSTWLTAFVLKCFKAAKRLDGDLIEDSKINRAIRFLLKKQKDDGSFAESGHLITSNIQGGVDNKETLTAYVLIALTEEKYDEKNEDLVSAIRNATNYLGERFGSVEDTYTLSIMTYAMTLVASPDAGKMLSRVGKRGIKSDNSRHWADKVIGASGCADGNYFCQFINRKSDSSDIEMTSYVLLAYVRMNMRGKWMPIVRWLAEQRGAFGGYYSTQDTVMAIQALSMVAAVFSKREMDLDIYVYPEGSEYFIASFDITEENAIVLQKTEMPASVGELKMKARGEGFADVQVMVSYNLPNGSMSDEPFTLNVTVSDKNKGDLVYLKVCSRINEDREEVVNVTGMYVVVVDLPSGYTIDDRDATKQNSDTKLIELEDQQVTGYFDDLLIGENKCMKLELTRYMEVSGVKPQLIKSYDYYNPALMAMRQYRLEKPRGVCDLCGPDCVGCPELPRETDHKGTPSAYCDEIDFPCPEYTDGLFYDPNSQITALLKDPAFAPKEYCSVPEGAGDSLRYRGPPGTYINGSSQYVLCDQTKDFRRALKERSGFTMAFLLHPTQMSFQKSYRLITMSSQDDSQTYLLFEKPARKQGFTVKIFIDGYEFSTETTGYYYVELLPAKSWAHMVVRFDNGPFPQMFLNGARMNAQQNAKWLEEYDLEIAKEVVMKIGKSDKDGFVGLASGLDFWLKPLSDTEVRSHYEYYLDVMLEEDPLFSEGQAEHVVPKSLWSCFDDPYIRASVMKVAVGEQPVLCADHKRKEST